MFSDDLPPMTLPPGTSEPPLPDVGFGRVVEFRGEPLAELLDQLQALIRRNPYAVTVGIDAEGFKIKAENYGWSPGRGTVRPA